MQVRQKVRRRFKFRLKLCNVRLWMSLVAELLTPRTLLRQNATDSDSDGELAIP